MQLEARTQEMLNVIMCSAHLPSKQSLKGNGSNQSIVHKLKSRGKAEQSDQVVKPCPWPTHTPFSLNPKGRLKAFFFLSDARCPCQLINQEQKSWPYSVTRMAKIVCPMNIETPSRMAAHSMPLRQQAYLCRWSHSPRSQVCRYSCVPGQCWCRWHSYHSCAAHCHIHRALFAGWKRKRDTFS